MGKRQHLKSAPCWLWLPRWAQGLRLVLCAAVLASPLARAAACGDQVRLTEPVPVSAEELAEFRAMAPLRVLSADAPPMARQDKATGGYSGIGVDVLCFIANRIGLRYEMLDGRGQSVTEKIQQVQDGDADAFMPLTDHSERVLRGVFTLPFYESHYAVIARKGWRPQAPIRGLADLAPYRVGVIKGVAFEPVLKRLVPAAQLTVYDDTSGERIFQALRNDRIDVAVYSKNVFSEKRYQHEYFDLEAIHTLDEAPRAYRFYFNASLNNQRVAAMFDRYLAVMDVSGAVAEHEDGERQFIERYAAERNRHLFVQAGGVAALLLALVLLVSLYRYRRLALLLAASNQHILQQQQALQAANHELEMLSQTDGLTGLANRRQFDHALQREHARRQRTGAPLSLLMVDLDHFKYVNDHYGHAIGDDYLRAVARVLKSSVTRATDLAARYGGEEFVCLLPETAPADAQMLAERIRQGVSAMALPNELASPQHLTLSIGVASLLSGQASAAQLLAQADEQLYAAKHAGRDRVHAVVLRE
ncbi:MAG: GGDEF domain-containing protein [Proteobacteria bacterium]|nr:GGDEF domain-containing protein [Pseudomonadota bacterium]